MQVTPAELAGTGAAAPGGVAALRVLAGDLTAAPVGELLRATVTQVAAGQATLDVNGQAVTVRTAGGLQPGAALLVRVPPNSANPTLELVGRAPTTPPASAPLPQTAPTAPPRVAVVDVLGTAADGRFQVRVDGRVEVAVSAEPLAAGSRYVLQVEPTPAGLALRPPPDSPKLATDVAAAVLRAARPLNLGAVVEPLMAELAAVPPTPGRPGPVELAAATVREAVRAFLPPDPTRPPNPTELQSLVEHGGLHHEAKLARQVTDTPGGETPAAAGGVPDRAAAPARSPDLKEGLLRLLQAAQDLGTAAQFPAARAALDGIEAQQAVNVVAQEHATPYVLQVPFPDGGEWRTLNLAVEPDERARPDPDRPSGGFRLLMHVPLADLGETWIDAGLAGDRFRAVLYLADAPARDRIRAELPGLRDQLLADGFAEVLLDVRPASELPAKQRRQAAAMTAGRPESVSVLDVKA